MWAQITWFNLNRVTVNETVTERFKGSFRWVAHLSWSYFFNTYLNSLTHYIDKVYVKLFNIKSKDCKT